MNAELFDALDELERETGIEKSYMFERIEAALLTAFKRDNPSAGVKIYFDEKKKMMKVYRLKEVTDEEGFSDEANQITLERAKEINPLYEVGSMAEIEFIPADFNRISALTAKQVIIQSIREAERNKLIREYESKKEEIISASIFKIDPPTGNAILDIGKGEAVLAKSEQIPGELLREGDRIKVYVIEVKNQTKGPLITLSRKHPGLVRRLFELEVPEIADGTVVIHSISREPGSRTKISVSSADPDVDPVGACIGARGARINNITSELGNEKIDVIRFSDDPVAYIKSALSPAAVVSVSVSAAGERICTAVVENNQLSLAIGKEGQNARLAAKLTGYKIDIKTPEQFADFESAAPDRPL